MRSLCAEYCALHVGSARKDEFRTVIGSRVELLVHAFVCIFFCRIILVKILASCSFLYGCPRLCIQTFCTDTLCISYQSVSRSVLLFTACPHCESHDSYEYERYHFLFHCANAPFKIRILSCKPVRRSYSAFRRDPSECRFRLSSMLPYPHMRDSHGHSDEYGTAS